MPGADMAANARLSSDSHTSESSDRSDPSSNNHSTSALILVREGEVGEDEDRSFTYTDEEEAFHAENNTAPEVILTPPLVFGYFLSPCLKLGSMLVLSSQAPLKLSLPALLIFSFLSVFSRQIWFLLARYVRKSDVGEIVAEAFVRGRREEGLDSFMKSIARLGSVLVRILLATVYFKGAISCLEPLWPDDVLHVPPSLALSVVFLIFLFPFSLAPTLASKRLVYSTWISNFLYIAWLCGIVYAHATGALNTDNVMIAQGRLLQDIPAVAFAFSSLSTLDIYSGMIGLHSSSDKKEKRYLSISSISFTAALVGTGLVLPVIFPSVKSHGDKEPTEDSITLRALIATLTTFILLLAIPPLIATSPPIRFSSTIRRRTFGRYALLILFFLLSLLPESVEPILEDTVVFLVLLSTYVLPALLHIILHNMRRPLSIIMDPRQLIKSSGLSSDQEDGDAGPSGHDRDTEELLLRKERSLQRRRFGRRIMWDIGVWILLVPVGGGGMVWAVGRLTRAW